MLFRPAAESDLDAIERHYTELLTHEAETGRSTTNWSLGVYPTRQTAAAALAAGTLWVLEREGEPVASVILNHHQDDFYATIGWQYPALPEQVLVVHTLCIPPRYAGRALAGSASPASSSWPPPWAAPSSGWIPGSAIFPPPPFTGKMVFRFAGAPRCFFRAKYRRSLFFSNTAASPAPIPRRSAAAKNGP